MPTVRSPSPAPTVEITAVAAWQPSPAEPVRLEAVPDVDRFWFGGEYLMWWIRDSQPPALVTGGAQASQGVLGRPGSVVLYGGDIDNDVRSGGRFKAGMWLDSCQRFGVEGGFLFLGNRSVDFVAGSGGDPLLARPFFNGATGGEDAQQVANLASGGVFPLAGQVTVANSSRLWGAELNGVAQPCSPGGYDIRYLAGFRFLKLDESLFIGEDFQTPVNSPQFGGARFLVADDFATRNEFYGGQVGSQARFRRGPLSLDLLAKVGLGVTHQTVAIKGATRIDEPGQLSRQFTGALLAQETNIGRYSRNQFAVVPELGVTGGWWMTDHLRATVGYTFLYWSNVARPGNQIDRFVNQTGIPPNTLRGTARPAFAFQDTDFWAHGVSLGLEYTY